MFFFCATDNNSRKYAMTQSLFSVKSNASTQVMFSYPPALRGSEEYNTIDASLPPNNDFVRDVVERSAMCDLDK